MCVVLELDVCVFCLYFNFGFLWPYLVGYFKAGVVKVKTKTMKGYIYSVLLIHQENWGEIHVIWAEDWVWREGLRE